MEIKGLIDECFGDYKKPAMYIAFPSCTFKCDALNKCKICQNSALALEPSIQISKEEIIERYLNNPLTEAIVISGLEPFDSIMDLLAFISALRDKYNCKDDVVIYTGYTEDEIINGAYLDCAFEVSDSYWRALINYPNIYIKFGRFIMNDTPHLDPILNVQLASKNQYAKKVSINNEN